MPAPVLPPPDRDIARYLPGMWLLRSREDHDAAGRRHIDPALGADPLGVLTFAPGRFAAQFMSREARTATGGSGANNSSAINGYDGYFGTYTLDEAAGTITVRLEGSVTRGDIGKSFIRAIRANAEELIIQLPTTTPEGVAITRTLRFARAK